VTHELGKLPNVAGVGLQEPGAEGAPEVVGLYLSLLQAALPDPYVQPVSQGVLGYARAFLGHEEVGERGVRLFALASAGGNERLPCLR
jgi:hypothetical protein